MDASLMPAGKQHLRFEDHKVVLIKSWYNRIKKNCFGGAEPLCKRCGLELEIGQRIHRSNGRTYYHETCFEGLFVDL